MNYLKNYEKVYFYRSKNKKLNKYEQIYLYILALFIKIFGAITSVINYRLYYRLSKLISFFISDNILCKIKIFKDTNFTFYFNDPYYNRLIFKNYKYESEIENFLRKIKVLKYIFLDVGANYGYWSVIVSSKNFGSKKAVAIEPVQENYRMCKNNYKLNKSRFTLINKGISRNKGKRYLYIDNYDRSAVGSTLIKPKHNLFKREQIQTIPISKLLMKYKKYKYFVIKLDVEGEEINCCKTINKNLSKKLLIIYEDHGSDNKNMNTKYLIQKGFKIFICSNNKISEIKKYTDLNKYKKQKRVGYNLFATSSNKFLSFLKND